MKVGTAPEGGQFTLQQLRVSRGAAAARVTKVKAASRVDLWNRIGNDGQSQ